MVWSSPMYGSGWKKNYEKVTITRKKTEMKPFYTHVCSGCEFIGQIEMLDMKLDFYLCPQCDGGTYIARFGNSPSSYYSTTGDILDSLIEKSNPRTRNGFLILAIRIWDKDRKGSK